MIKVCLLGRLSAIGVHGQSAAFHTRRASELFAFMVLESGRMFHRTRLAEQFWGHLPEKRGRRALNTELWRITTSLKAIGMDVGRAIRRSQHEIGYMKQADHQIDAEQVREAAAIVAALDPADVDTESLRVVEQGISAYRGDLLESVYSDWCLLWRESLRAQHTELLEFMLQASMARQDWASGLRYGRQLLSLDPLMEHVHRAIMRCHYHNGDRPLAMRQYALCEQLLREELGIEPMDETRRIQQTILAVAPRPPQALDEKPAMPRRRAASTRTPAQKVDMALSNINSARTWLEETSRDLRRNPHSRS